MAKQGRRSLSSKTSVTERVRVVHISNPTMVTATPSEFMAVVQSLTGRKRSCACVTTSDCHGLPWDCEKTHHVKVAKLQHHLSRSSNHRTPRAGSPISEDRLCNGENNMRNGDDAFQIVRDEMSALFTSHICEALENIGYSGFFSDLVFNQVEE